LQEFFPCFYDIIYFEIKKGRNLTPVVGAILPPKLAVATFSGPMVFAIAKPDQRACESRPVILQEQVFLPTREPLGICVL